MPLLKLKQGLSGVSVGSEIEILATDEGSWRDIPAFVAMTQHLMIEQQKVADEFHFVVQKGE
jgi:TusA-related sulfurtransferase